CPLEAGLDGSGIPEQIGGIGNIANGRFQACQTLCLALRVEIEADTTRTYHSAAEAAAAKQRRQIEEISPEPAAAGEGRQVAPVPGRRPEVAGVIRNALELQCDAAEHLGTDRNLTARKTLSQLTVGRGMADGRVARHGLHRVNCPLVRSAGQRSLGAPVLIS